MKDWKALDRRVLVVASVNEILGDWTVYIGAVPGIDHEKEWQEVAQYGTKLPKEVGEILFPGLKALKWRY